MTWSEIELGELIHVKHGFAFKSEYFSSEGAQIVLTPGNFFESGGFKSRGEKDRFYTGDYPKQYLLDKGDIVVAMTEQGVGLLGSAAIIPDNNKFLHNQRLGLVQIKDPSRVDLFFLYLVFNNEIIRSQIAGSATGTKVKHTAPERIYKCRFKFPLLAEQQKISAIVSAYDELIENNLERIKLLEEMAQITYEEWFVRMKYPGHEEAAIDAETGLHDEWEYKTLDSISDVTSSKRIFLSDYVEDGIKFYRGKEIILKSKNQDISDQLFISNERFDEIKEKFGAPSEGDILITAVGTLGYPYLVKKSDGDFYFKDGNLIWLKDIISIDMSLYLISIFNSKEFKTRLDNIAIGSSQKALTIKAVKSLKVISPSVKVLTQFGELISPIKGAVDSLLNQNNLLKEARDILLPRLMTGMIDIDKVDLPEALLERVNKK